MHRGSERERERKRVMRKAGMEETKEELEIGGRKINNFADDTTPIAANITNFQNLILKVKSVSEEAGLFLNLMSATKLQGFTLGKKELDVVSSFTFLLLGSTIEVNGDSRGDVRRRLALGRAAVA